MTEKKDYPHLIRIVEDFSLQPNEYCVKVENGQLLLGVYSRSFTGIANKAQALLKEKLTGDEVLEWDDGYYEKGSCELTAKPYTQVTSGIYLYGGTQKDPLTYTESDEITFSLSCISGETLVSVPWVKYEIYNDTTGKKYSG